jgi:hypothetical protein
VTDTVESAYSLDKKEINKIGMSNKNACIYCTVCDNEYHVLWKELVGLHRSAIKIPRK